MAKLVYSMLVSLDGFVARDDGSLDWHVITEEWHRFVNEETESAAAILYGRRMWDLMIEYWPFADSDPSVPDYIAEYSRIWRSKEKIVCSTTLDEDPGWGARVVRTVDEIRELKAETFGVILAGGPTLAGSLVGHDLVDEYALHLQPLAIGTGRRYWPAAGCRDLELLETREFASGVVYLRYGRVEQTDARGA